LPVSPVEQERQTAALTFTSRTTPTGRGRGVKGKLPKALGMLASSWDTRVVPRRLTSFTSLRRLNPPSGDWFATAPVTARTRPDLSSEPAP